MWRDNKWLRELLVCASLSVFAYGCGGGPASPPPPPPMQNPTPSITTVSPCFGEQPGS